MKKTILFLAVLLAVALPVRATGAAPSINTCEDTTCTGNRLVKDGWIIQVMGVTDDSAPDTPAYRIARAPLDSPSDWQTLFGPATHYIGYLCDMGDWIAFADNTHSILYAMNPDGSGVRALYESPTPIEQMLQADGELYFCNSGGLYRWTSDGPEALFETPHRMARYLARVSDALIFSVGSGEGVAPDSATGLFLLPLNGGDGKQLTQGKPSSFAVHDGVLFTALDGATVAIRLDDGSRKTVCERTFTFRQQADGCYFVGEQLEDGYHLRLYISEDGAFDPDVMTMLELDDRHFLLNGCMTVVEADGSLTLTPLDEWLTGCLK